MRILAFSDLHDDEEALLLLKKYADRIRFDLVLVAGDITNKGVSYCEDLITFFPRAFLVPGNNEPANVMEFLKNTKNYVHEKRVEIGNGLNVVGFGYSNITPFGTPNEYSEDEIYARMNKLAIDQNTILLLHCPPFGFFDTVRGKSIGSTAIKRIIEEKQPLLAIAGHVHEYEGSARLENTTIAKVATAQVGKALSITIEARTVFVDKISIT